MKKNQQKKANQKKKIRKMTLVNHAKYLQNKNSQIPYKSELKIMALKPKESNSLSTQPL